jgi:diacylglycerol O-acyltransferase
MKRMNAIMASTGKVKQALVSLKSVLPTDYPSFLAPWIVGGAARAALKTYGRSGFADRLPMVANLAISNVPGPQVPLYLAGARMLTFHPLSIVMHGLALNITIQTYAGSVDFGVIADKKAVPHVQDLADALQAAFEEAQKLYALGQASVVTTTAPVAKETKSRVRTSKAGSPCPCKNRQSCYREATQDQPRQSRQPMLMATKRSPRTPGRPARTQPRAARA